MVAVLLFLVIQGLEMFHRSSQRLPPGPTPLPVLGNLLSFIRGRSYKTWTQMTETFGPVFTLHLGSITAVVVNDLKTIKEVQSKRAFSGRPSNQSMYRYFSHGYNDIVFTNISQEWRQLYKVIHQQIFSSGRLRDAQTVIKTETKEFCDLLDTMSDGEGQIDPHDCVNLLSANIIMRLVFGTRFTPDDEEFQTFRANVKRATENIGAAHITNCLPWMKYVPFQTASQASDDVVSSVAKNWELGETWLRRSIETFELDGKDSYSTLADRLIAASLAESGTDNVDDVPGYASAPFDEVVSGKRKHDVTFNGDRVRGCVLDMLGAGFDTTTQTLRWILLLLAKYPDAQKRAREEVLRQASDDNNEPIRFPTTTPYVDAFIREAMRCYNIAPVSLPHEATEEDTISGYSVPKGSWILLNMYAIHHDPKVWEEPETFNPDRWLTADEDQRKKMMKHWQPFSEGRRSCMGKDVAMMTIYSVCVEVLKKFHVGEASGKPLDFGLDERYGDAVVTKPYTLTFKPRNEQ